MKFDDALVDRAARAEGFKNVGAFADYWNGLTKAHQWHENPWVSVIGFKPVFENIDKLRRHEVLT